MKKGNSILLLLIMIFSFMNYSCRTRKPYSKYANTLDLKQYVGEYMYEAAGIKIKIYTKEEESDTKLYLYVIGDRENELIATEEHKFSFKTEKKFKVEFNNAENGVFNEF